MHGRYITLNGERCIYTAQTECLMSGLEEYYIDQFIFCVGHTSINKVVVGSFTESEESLDYVREDAFVTRQTVHKFAFI